MDCRMKRDNRGWTLVEIIIVVAIISIILGISGYGLNLINGKPAEKCARKIVSILQDSRTVAQGKYQVTCQISENVSTGEIVMTRTICNSHADFLAGTVTVDTEVIGERDVTVEYTLDDGTGISYSVNTTPLVLTYERATGGFLPILPAAYCNQIVVTKASTVRTIELVPPTGRVSMN